jgi:hypothetical protein
MREIWADSRSCNSSLKMEGKRSSLPEPAGARRNMLEMTSSSEILGAVISATPCPALAFLVRSHIMERDEEEDPRRTAELENENADELVAASMRRAIMDLMANIFSGGK